MRRRPPRSTRTDTLFPYTTLSRSCCQGGNADTLLLCGGDGLGARPLRRLLDQPAVIPFRVLPPVRRGLGLGRRSEEHTSELQSLMRISYAVFCLTKKSYHTRQIQHNHTITPTTQNHHNKTHR